jgi:hypothetical protein
MVTHVISRRTAVMAPVSRRARDERPSTVRVHTQELGVRPDEEKTTRTDPVPHTTGLPIVLQKTFDATVRMNTR